MLLNLFPLYSFSHDARIALSLASSFSLYGKAETSFILFIWTNEKFRKYNRPMQNALQNHLDLIYNRSSLKSVLFIKKL